MNQEIIKSGTIQETLFIPHYARAQESQKSNPLLKDEKAREILEKIPYNFEKFKNKRSLFTNVFRTYLFDQWVIDFISKNSKGTIVELGVGLNTRYERLKNYNNSENFMWLEFDLEDSISLRKQFFSNEKNRIIEVGSIIEKDWIYKTLNYSPPYFLISEAVLIYLEEDMVKTAIQNIGNYFKNKNSFLAFDSGSDDVIQNQHTHDILKHMGAKLKWALNDLHKITEWAENIHLKETRLLLDLDKELKSRLTLMHRLFYPIYNYIFLRWCLEYRLNLYEIY